MNTIHPEPPHRLGAIEHLAMALRIAAQAVISDIETNALAVKRGAVTWWDVRPMLDPHEQPPEAIDMASQAITYALDAELVTRHPEQPHLLLIVRHP